MKMNRESVKKNIFGRPELLERMKISEETLKIWEERKMIKPFGFTDDRVPFYAEETIEKIELIRKLSELGYEIEVIEKIIRKIGLPRTVGRKGNRMKLDQYLTVGGLAERVGVSARTIKYWEDRGIIDPDMRSEGGYRFYSEGYVFLCNLIQDLQLFGYTLGRIKLVSDLFRDFLELSRDGASRPGRENLNKAEKMLDEIKSLFEKMELLKAGIGRWEDLLKDKKKEIGGLKKRIQKRILEEEKREKKCPKSY